MKRPVAVLVFGILNILWGLFGVAAIVLALVSMKQPNNPFVTAVRDIPVLAAWMKISIPLGIAISIALLVGAVGLLLLKRWGWQLTLICAGSQILVNVIGVILNIGFILPAMSRQATNMGPEGMGLVASTLFSIIIILFGTSYAVLLLVFMLRSNVTAAFSAGPPDLPFRKT